MMKTHLGIYRRCHYTQMKIRNDSQATSANLTDLKNSVTYFLDIPKGIGLQYLQSRIITSLV